MKGWRHERRMMDCRRDGRSCPSSTKLRDTRQRSARPTDHPDWNPVEPRPRTSVREILDMGVRASTLMAISQRKFE